MGCTSSKSLRSYAAIEEILHVPPPPTIVEKAIAPLKKSRRDDGDFSSGGSTSGTPKPRCHPIPLHQVSNSENLSLMNVKTQNFCSHDEIHELPKVSSSYNRLTQHYAPFHYKLIDGRSDSQYEMTSYKSSEPESETSSSQTAESSSDSKTTTGEEAEFEDLVGKRERDRERINIQNISSVSSRSFRGFPEFGKRVSVEEIEKKIKDLEHCEEMKTLEIENETLKLRLLEMERLKHLEEENKMLKLKLAKDEKEKSMGDLLLKTSKTLNQVNLSKAEIIPVQIKKEVEDELKIMFFNSTIFEELKGLNSPSEKSKKKNSKENESKYFPVEKQEELKKPNKKKSNPNSRHVNNEIIDIETPGFHDKGENPMEFSYIEPCDMFDGDFSSGSFFIFDSSNNNNNNNNNGTFNFHSGCPHNNFMNDSEASQIFNMFDQQNEFSFMSQFPRPHQPNPQFSNPESTNRFFDHPYEYPNYQFHVHSNVQIDDNCEDYKNCEGKKQDDQNEFIKIKNEDQSFKLLDSSLRRPDQKSSNEINFYQFKEPSNDSDQVLNTKKEEKLKREVHEKPKPPDFSLFKGEVKRRKSKKEIVTSEEELCQCGGRGSGDNAFNRNAIPDPKPLNQTRKDLDQVNEEIKVKSVKSPEIKPPKDTLELKPELVDEESERESVRVKRNTYENYPRIILEEIEYYDSDVSYYTSTDVYKVKNKKFSRIKPIIVKREDEEKEETSQDLNEVIEMINRRQNSYQNSYDELHPNPMPEESKHPSMPPQLKDLKTQFGAKNLNSDDKWTRMSLGLRSEPPRSKINVDQQLKKGFKNLQDLEIAADADLSNKSKYFNGNRPHKTYNPKVSHSFPKAEFPKEVKKKLKIKGLKNFIQHRGRFSPTWVKEFPCKSRFHPDNYIYEREGPNKPPTLHTEGIKANCKKSGKCDTCGIYNENICTFCHRCPGDCACPPIPSFMNNGWEDAINLLKNMGKKDEEIHKVTPHCDQDQPIGKSDSKLRYDRMTKKEGINEAVNQAKAAAEQGMGQQPYPYPGYPYSYPYPSYPYPYYPIPPPPPMYPGYGYPYPGYGGYPNYYPQSQPQPEEKPKVINNETINSIPDDLVNKDLKFFKNCRIIRSEVNHDYYPSKKVSVEPLDGSARFTTS